MAKIEVVGVETVETFRSYGGGTSEERSTVTLSVVGEATASEIQRVAERAIMDPLGYIGHIEDVRLSKPYGQVGDDALIDVLFLVEKEW